MLLPKLIHVELGGDDIPPYFENQPRFYICPSLTSNIDDEDEEEEEEEEEEEGF